mmetsp:Transcript_19354/g.27215  ORF Transcript_19354/g.27215 Transcript_19354/m.27215 type:complete len:147 (-) Transcript_19354:88-528(-)
MFSGIILFSIPAEEDIENSFVFLAVEVIPMRCLLLVSDPKLMKGRFQALKKQAVEYATLGGGIIVTLDANSIALHSITVLSSNKNVKSTSNKNKEIMLLISNFLLKQNNGHFMDISKNNHQLVLSNHLNGSRDGCYDQVYIKLLRH